MKKFLFVITIFVGFFAHSQTPNNSGGGGTFVVRTGNIPLIIAGGGGGASGQCCNTGSQNGRPGVITTSGTNGVGNTSTPDGTGGSGGNGGTGGLRFGAGGGGGFNSNGGDGQLPATPQEQAYGGLNPEAQRELNQLIKLHANKSGNRTEPPRRIKPGAIVLREWKGQTHRVTVLSKGFYYNEQTYLSLSEVARAITGTRWNGPRFFGLRKPELPKETSATSLKPMKAPRGIPPIRAVRPSAALAPGGQQ